MSVNIETFQVGIVNQMEVINLLPELEDKKKFIDRVMTLIINQVDAKFIKFGNKDGIDDKSGNIKINENKSFSRV